MRLGRCLCCICAAEHAARQLFLKETCDGPETFQPLKHEAVCNQFTTSQGCSTICVVIFPKYLGKIQMVSGLVGFLSVSLQVSPELTSLYYSLLNEAQTSVTVLQYHCFN